MDTLTVFISSAIGEFAAERKALKAALERWQFVRAWVFEQEAAHSRPVVEDYLRRVAECDVYVLLLGKGLSTAVESEYRIACDHKRPVLVFIQDIPKEKREESATKLINEFEKELAFKYARFENVQDLEVKVLDAIGKEIAERVHLTTAQTYQFVRGMPRLPRLSQAERDELDDAYLSEVKQKYEDLRTLYTPLAAIARLSPESAPVPTAARVEFLPREFVLLRKEFSRGEPKTDEQKTQHYDDLREAIGKYGDLILLGDPGAGKTTTLWRLMFDYATKGQSDRTTKLPVLISLGRYDGKSDILDFLRAELVLQSKGNAPDKVFPKHRRLAAHLDEYLEDGRLILLFDALNEMPQAHYSDSIRRLEDFRSAQLGNLFIFTSRALDYTTKMNVSEATIQELDEDAQKDFLTAHFDSGTQLFEKLRDSHTDLLDIGRNPYMLLMIGQVYQLKGELPSNRGLLFRSFVNVLMERERKTHPDRWLDAEIQIRVLSDLAFAIQREHGRGTSVPREWADKYLTGSVRVKGRSVQYNPADLLYLARSASLLDESSGGSLRFTHQLLQEYFVAVAFLRLGVNGPQVLEAARYYSWDEVLVLLAGLMDDATPLVELVMAVDPWLAARCVGVARVISTDAVKTLITQLDGKLTSQYYVQRVNAIWAMAATRSEIAIPYLLRLTKEEWSEIKALDAMHASYSYKIIPYVLPLIDGEDAGMRSVALTLLSWNSGETIIPHLDQLLNHKYSDVREIAIRIMCEIKSDDVIPYLLRLPPNSAIWPLINLGTNAASQSLLPLLNDTEIDKDTLKPALALIAKWQGAAAIPHILFFLQSRNLYSRAVAAKALGETLPDAAIPHLIALIKKLALTNKSEDHVVLLAAAEALSTFNPDKVVPQLIWLLRDDEENIRGCAEEAFRKFKPEVATPFLIPLLQDKEASIRKAAVGAFLSLSSEIAVPFLEPLLQDEDSRLRYLVQRTLEKLREQHEHPFGHLIEDGNPDLQEIGVEFLAQNNPPEVAVALLLKLLNYKRSIVRREAIRYLVRFKAESAIPYIIALLKDEDAGVREMAIRGLRELNADISVTQVVSLLSDTYSKVRTEAVVALQGLRAEPAIPNLISLLSDEDDNVRAAAAETIGMLRAQAAVPHLIALIKDENSNVAGAAITALGLLQVHQIVPDLVKLIERFLWDESREAPSGIGRTIETMAEEEHLPLLKPLLSVDNPDVRSGVFEIIEAVKRRLNLPKDYVIPRKEQ